MNKFRTRLKYYLFGMTIGLVFMYFLFGNRGCAWLPENRVKNMIAEKEILIGDSIQYLMDCQGVTNSDIYDLLNEDGDVEFSLSKTDVKPKEYHIAGIKDDKDISIRYALGDSLVEVIDFDFGSKECSTDISNSNKEVVKLPLDEVIEIIETQDFRLMEQAGCQIDCLGLTQEEIFNFHNGAKVYVSESEPRLQPNPYYELTGFIDSKELSITYIIGENRTRISKVESKKAGCECELTF